MTQKQGPWSRFFTPGNQEWSDHFQWAKDGLRIVGKTPIGRATVIALRDERTAGALVDVLHRQQMFYELPGFLALAGDASAVVPLLHTIIRVPDDDRYDLAMALTAIAHRIGREALVAELDKTAPAEQSREVSQTRAGQILQRPASAAEEHFALFYRGLAPEDMAQVMGK